LVGVNSAPQVLGLDELPGKSNYFIGNDPTNWRTDISNYAKVQYKAVYPGIDLVYYGRQGRLENDFVVAPGANPNKVRLYIKGAKTIRRDADGNLIVRVEDGELLLHKPVISQDQNGNKQIVEGQFVRTAHDEIGFRVGSYDKTRPLVIDPVLTY